MRSRYASCVASFGNLQHVESEFSFQMRQRIFIVSDSIAVLAAEFGIEQRHREVCAGAMTFVVRGVMRQGAERERVLVQVLRIAQQRRDKISTAHVVNQVAE